MMSAMMKPLVLALFLGVALGAPVRAAPQSYEDEAAFATAAGLLSVEDFSGRTVGSSLAGTVDFGGFTTTLVSTVGGPFFNVVGTGPSLPYGLNALGLSGTNLQVGLRRGETFTFTFATAITAFGATFAGVNDFVRRSGFSAAGSTDWLGVVQDWNARFFGVVSDTPFTTVTITGGPFSEGFGIDNVRWASAPIPTPVPLPASGLLLLAGVAAVGLLGRRRARP